MDIENLGGGAALKLVRFLKNVKNFGSLSLMGKLRTAAVPVVPAALFGVSAVGGSLQAASISETLQIGPLQQVMMQDCIDNHDEEMVMFGENVSTAQGCACTAKLVSSVTPPAHYKAYRALHKFNLGQWDWEYESSAEKDRAAEYEVRLTAGLKAIEQSAGVNVKGLRHMNGYINSAENVCDMTESYVGNSGAELAGLRPLETPIWEGESEGIVQISLRGAQQPLRISQK